MLELIVFDPLFHRSRSILSDFAAKVATGLDAFTSDVERENHTVSAESAKVASELDVTDEESICRTKDHGMEQQSLVLHGAFSEVNHRCGCC